MFSLIPNLYLKKKKNQQQKNAYDVLQKQPWKLRIVK